jgi:hypothetical protein
LQQDFPRLELTPVTLDIQNYAFALALDSPIRKVLDVALLDALSSPWWEDTRFHYLGRNASN